MKVKSTCSMFFSFLLLHVFSCSFCSKNNGLSLSINACLPTSKLSFFFQDAEGDEEEDDDPDYQPPPVSLKCQLIHALHTDRLFLEYRFLQERNRLKGNSKAKSYKNACNFERLPLNEQTVLVKTNKYMEHMK